MAFIPDLTSLLCLDSKSSSSLFSGQHRTILIEKDFTNIGDFAFSSFLHYFSRKEPNTPILLVTLSHSWTHYVASAIKCGVSLRKTQNSGKIEHLDVAEKILLAASDAETQNFNLCDFIMESSLTFVEKHFSAQRSSNAPESLAPIIIMIDDLSALLNMGCSTNQLYQLFTSLDRIMRDRSKELSPNSLSHLIVQTLMGCTAKTSVGLQVYPQDYMNLNHLLSNLENLCDLILTLRPLDTGFSTRVDGTIKIVDNRLPTAGKNSSSSSQVVSLTLLPDSQSEIGIKKAFFFKLGDRRVRLTSSALIF